MPSTRPRFAARTPANPTDVRVTRNRIESLIRPFSTPLSAWGVHLALVLLTAAITVQQTPERDNFRPEASGFADYVVSPLSTWDSDWYVRIANQGYGHREATAAFWPLYPTLLSAGHHVTGLSAGTIGVIISNTLFLAALICLFRYVGMVYGQPVARRAIWIAALSPFAFFFSAAYTESLFLLLSVGAITLALANRWTPAALLVVLASLTRSSGVLLLLPLAIVLIRQRGRNPANWWTTGIQLIAAGLAPIAFAVHLDRIRGDPLLMVRVQERWGRTSAMPWETLADAVHRMHGIYATGRHGCNPGFSSAAFRTCQASLQLNAQDISDDLSFVFTVGCLLIVPIAFLRLRLWDSSYYAAGLVLPLLAPTPLDPLASMGRYALVLFPVYVVLAMLLSRRAMFLIALLLSALAMMGALALFAQGYFIA